MDRAVARVTAPGQDGEPGLEAIYRRIPSWPRILLILQSAALYCYTGVVKNGGVWWKGDAFYYAFNLDHFHRVPPQVLSSYAGTTLFRVNSHVAHAWESLFPHGWSLGMVVRFVLRDNVPQAESPPRRQLCNGFAWIALGLGALAICWVAYPGALHPAQARRLCVGRHHPHAHGSLRGIWLSGMLGVWFGWRRLRDRPPFDGPFAAKSTCSTWTPFASGRSVAVCG